MITLLIVIPIIIILLVIINIKRKKDLEDKLRFKVMYGVTGEEKN